MKTPVPTGSALLRLPFERSYWVAPGQLLAGCYPGDLDPALARQKLGRLLDCGVRLVVNLMEPDEVDHLGRPFADYLPALTALAVTRGLEVKCRRLSIPDMDVPSPQVMRGILDAIDQGVAAGGVVYVHCWGGKGRTGTVVGCWLVRRQLASDGRAALARIEELTASARAVFWPTPQTDEQRRFVVQWSESSTAPPPKTREDLF